MLRGDPKVRSLMASCTAFAITVLAGWPGAAHAGEVRMNVGAGGNLFVDPVTGVGHRYLNCNPGDHVVWIWTAGSHTCTSGDSSTFTGDGGWDSGLLTSGSPNYSFSWRATGTGTFLYFCNPHAPGMAGRVIVGSGINVSDFRITEVLYSDAAGHDLIEITNIGNAAGDFGRYRIVAGGLPFTILANSVPLAPGQTLTIHTNETGTNTTDLFTTALGDLGNATGAVSLYAPNTKPGTSLADATQIIDFVEWGATGGANEATALAAGVWTGGQFAPVVAAGHSIEFCGDATQHAGRWWNNGVPNFSGQPDNCITVPVLRSTWGRIKTLYR